MQYFAKTTDFRALLDSKACLFYLKEESWLLYLKAVFFISWSAASYLLLVFVSAHTLTAVVFGLCLALGLVGVGFNIQHDGNHGSFSRSRRVNRLAGWSLDLIGASSYFWKSKHNKSHHTYTNIPGKDIDIEIGGFARLSRDHVWKPVHRYQQYYLWVLYCFVHFRYLYSDLQRIFLGKRDGTDVKFPKGIELCGMIVCKSIFMLYAIFVPLFVHPWWKVVVFYLGISMTMGFILSLVFQLAHSVDNVWHPTAEELLAPLEWNIHQIKTTSDFAQANPLVTFFVGGLNYQIEHHLFHHLPHTCYPELAAVVRQACEERGITYNEHKTLWEAIKSHHHFLKVMGQEP